MVERCSPIVEEIRRRINYERKSKERKLELEDDKSILKSKCRILADAIKSAQHVVVYTGAGLSTAANIPDYRGPDGVWTQLKKTGKRPASVDIASTSKLI